VQIFGHLKEKVAETSFGEERVGGAVSLGLCDFETSIHECSTGK
jgi:hypothetical protein